MGLYSRFAMHYPHHPTTVTVAVGFGEEMTVYLRMTDLIIARHADTQHEAPTRHESRQEGHTGLKACPASYLNPQSLVYPVPYPPAI